MCERQTVVQACFLSLSPSHTHTYIHCFFDNNFVPTKRQSYHTFPPPPRCWHENTRMLCNMQFITKTTIHIQSHPNNSISCTMKALLSILVQIVTFQTCIWILFKTPIVLTEDFHGYPQ